MEVISFFINNLRKAEDPRLIALNENYSEIATLGLPAID
jgi:hypothetical protein